MPSWPRPWQWAIGATPLRTVVCLLAFVAINLVVVRPSEAQISPGPLSKAHETLSGPLNCTKCHEIGAGRGQAKCVVCHSEIGQRVAEHRGMHAVWTAGKDCASCHSEHNGADFPLVRWQPSRDAFDHGQTGFTLTGKHAGVSCTACHKAGNIPTAARAGIKAKDLNHTFLGLSRDCGSCHADEHRGQLGTACARCHTTAGWKPASGFSHSSTKFPLTGAHASVECLKCHATASSRPGLASGSSAAKPYVAYTGLQSGSCAACHADPHKGSFAGTCQSCHNTSSWTRVAQLQGFDHSKTAFALVGKHRAVTCSACHRSGNFKTPVAHTRCGDCHQDAHRGQFASRADRGECASCHTANGFQTTTFDVKAHVATTYPLDGRHMAVACDRCHVPKGKDTVFRIKTTTCAACHSDIHKGQFTAAHANRCEDCHTVQAFRPAQFTLVSHRSTRFPLTGAHMAVTCVQCHTEPPRGSAAPTKYHYDDRACAACHQDPHRGEFRVQMAALRADGTAAGCEACHTTNRWNQIPAFDHAKTSFTLTGAHRAVACRDCHRPPNLEATGLAADFRTAPKECSGCHEDPHANQFAARKDVSGCASCHSTGAWKTLDFNHDARTTFSLLGAHQKVACAACHTVRRSVNGRAVVFYRPTPGDCKVCHAST